LLIFAFVVATAGGFITYRSLVNRAGSRQEAAPTVRLVLAARDLEVGTMLTENDLRAADWPGAVPAGAASKVGDLVGRGVISKVIAKEPVLESRLAPRGAGGGLASTIPTGWRAVAVRVNEVVGVAGFVVPGMHVDVLISGQRPGDLSNAGMRTRTLLQNLEVLSAGQDMKKDAEGKPVTVQVINLLVTPGQAEQLSLAAAQTSIQLVLRNPLDHDEAKTPGVAMAELFGGQSGDAAARPASELPRPRPAAPRLAAPKKKPEPFVLEIISGRKRSETHFSDEEEK